MTTPYRSVKIGIGECKTMLEVGLNVDLRTGELNQYYYNSVSIEFNLYVIPLLYNDSSHQTHPY